MAAAPLITNFPEPAVYCDVCSISLDVNRKRSHPVTRKKVCNSCFFHYFRHKVDRPEHKWRYGAPNKCGNCNLKLRGPEIAVHPLTRVALCCVCYDFFKTFNRDRDVNGKKRAAKKQIGRCGNCFCSIKEDMRTHTLTGVVICKVCYQYYQRNNRNRPLYLEKRRTRKQAEDDVEEQSKSDDDDAPAENPQYIQNIPPNVQTDINNNSIFDDLDFPMPYEQFSYYDTNPYHSSTEFSNQPMFSQDSTQSWAWDDWGTHY